MNLHEPVWVESIASTNKFWQEKIKSGENVKSGSVLAAKEQYAGRGRFDRKWLVKKGENLTFSLVFQTDATFPEIATVPMAVSLGIAEYLQMKGVFAQGKWPNDILIVNKKICGILSEKVSFSGLDYIIVGIGLNINMSAEDAEMINKPTTSLAIETSQFYDIKNELKVLLPFVSKYLQIWHESGFAGFKTQWCKIAWLFAEEVVIIDGNHEYSGLLRDFGDYGQLLVELVDGQIREFWSGDVSIKR